MSKKYRPKKPPVITKDEKRFNAFVEQAVKNARSKEAKLKNQEWFLESYRQTFKYKMQEARPTSFDGSTAKKSIFEIGVRLKD